MPELPEVEVTRQGIAPHLEGRLLRGAQVRESRLRWPVPADLDALVRDREVAAVRRRAKYLILDLARSDRPTTALLIHLGMSGSLRVVPEATPLHRHDHLDLRIEGGSVLRLRDPRRFGAVLWTETEPEGHERLAGLGPEPLGHELTGAYLYRRSRGRTATVKAFLMDASVVVGVGNIYASEALFRAGIHPGRAAGRLGRTRYTRLAGAVQQILTEAIAAGGTTLRDFTDSEGAPGYFRQQLAVYGHEGAPCPGCGRALRRAVIAQRASFFCTRCQR
ncbi:bifunctional DNA-formamidopyrimidine glycosylase/DNA-(apurinic or apyrimidinic site) lyase [Thiohalorhabdus sp.]|uniref:bifunctional DNA-formamidopyrimidine glycosylase/DNA-(apurinic or apyrimidinic site) lyase n=1 Tax=Thiohalorhabdus sp. TaxID=3094134 RepID=UPI002FC2C9AE